MRHSATVSKSYDILSLSETGHLAPFTNMD